LDKRLGLSQDFPFLSIGRLRERVVQRKPLDAIDLAIVLTRISTSGAEKIKRDDLEDTNRRLLPSCIVRVLDGVDTSDNFAKKPGFFLDFALCGNLGCLTLFDESFGKGPGLAVMWLNQRHFCGIAGLKPTSGRIPRTGHIISSEGVFQSFTQPGPMARRVEDLIKVFPILAGPDQIDPWIVPVPVRKPNAVALRRLRVVVHGDNGIRSPDTWCIRSVTNAAKALKAVGCRVEEFRPSDLAVTYELGNRLWRAAGSATVRRLLEASGTTEVSPPLRLWLNAPANPPEDWTALLEQFDHARRRMLALFDRCDAILCPPCAYVAFEHGATQREDLDSGFSYSEVFNYLGWPAAVVRCGETDKGLPVGVQIVSRPWREDIVLALALELERAFGGWQPPSI